MAEPERLFRPGDEPVGAIVKELFKDIGDLIRSEIRLAVAEAKSAAVASAMGAIWLVVGAVAALFGVLFLLVAATAALATTMSVWLAALIVAVAVLVVAGLTAWFGYQKLTSADYTLSTTRETLQEDAEWLKNRK